MKYCPKCGAELPEDVKFCVKCGASLLEPPVPKPVEKPAEPTQPPISYALMYRPPKPKSKTSTIIGVVVIVAIVIIASAFYMLTKREGGTTFWGGDESGGESQSKDTDGDGIPDVDDIDDDNDGYKDTEDYMPYKDAKIKIILKKFKVIDEVDMWSDEAQVYFKIEINDKYETRAPNETTYWSATVGVLRTVNWEYTKNVPDNVQLHKINIQMWDYDSGWDDDTLDIDGSDNTKGLTVQYNIQSGIWTGDDTDGVTDGSYDGTQASDDDDAYLEYSIITV